MDAIVAIIGTVGCPIFINSMLIYFSYKLRKENEYLMEQIKRNEVPKEKVKMYYKYRVIHNEELLHLVREMNMTVSEILNDFYYIDSRGFKVDDRLACRNLIVNIIYKHHRNELYKEMMIKRYEKMQKLQRDID